VKSSFIREALLLAALAFVPAIGQAIYFRDKVSWQSPVPASEMVDVDLARSWGANAIWLDARPENEFEQEHVPGAMLLNEDRWNELLPQVLANWSPDKKVVVYCSTQSCNLSTQVAHRLREEAQLKDNEGKNCVFVLQGGWEEWLKKK
jgi:rhodanese-related sulfurtransferase